MGKKAKPTSPMPYVQVDITARQFSASFRCPQDQAHKIIRRMRLSRFTRKKVCTLVSIKTVQDGN